MGRILLKCILNKYRRTCSGFIWLSIPTGGWLLWLNELWSSGWRNLTSCSSLQIFIYCWITLHVSVVHRAHHQGHIKLVAASGTDRLVLVSLFYLPNYVRSHSHWPVCCCYFFVMFCFLQTLPTCVQIICTLNLWSISSKFLIVASLYLFIRKLYFISDVQYI